AGVLAPRREEMVRTAAQRLVAMTDAELRKGRVAIPNVGRTQKELERPFLEVYVRGRQEVLKERGRQLGKIPTVKLQGDDEDDEFAVTKAQRAWVTTLAAGVVVAMVKGMENRGIEEATSVRQAELDPKEQRIRIENALSGLSENVIQQDLRAAMNTSFVTGREEQADAMRDEIATSFYSAIMDEGTEKCADAGGTCAALDGEEHEQGDPEYTVPNPNCAWTPNCRCTNVNIFRGAEEEGG
ncbi:MAG TPA: hypothetical protein VI893_10855, partial [Thermoplasmata archaeon]|nr:hypothetical protein [Thermoplasmata archaeon]